MEAELKSHGFSLPGGPVSEPVSTRLKRWAGSRLEACRSRSRGRRSPGGFEKESLWEAGW